MKALHFIALIVLTGIVGGVALQIYGQPPLIVAFFLAIGVASLVYGFLGGIEDATFSLGPFKTGGSLAALVGVAWFANYFLEQQTRLDMHYDFDPPAVTWFAVDKDKGIPISVEVPRAKATIDKPDLDKFRTRPLELVSNSRGIFAISPVDPDYIIGLLRPEELERTGFFNKLDSKVRNFVVTDRLPPNTEVRLDPIEFKLETNTYSSEYTHYSLLDKSGRIVDRGSIYRRGAKVYEIEGKRYIIMVVEVNHETEPKYAKFAIGKLISRTSLLE